ncbi:hypothetical protein LTR85_008114 [Meristemomyces frigidus]|nr:hypothetical protein LTR85_008114 [Meristemomyces frigidus]
MAASTKNILIFGATGLIGEHITKAILDKKENFGRIGIFTSETTLKTKPEQIGHLESQGVEIITGDITSEDAVKDAYNGFDTVVSCVGRPAIHHQLKLIELADHHPGIKRFFPSEYGTDIEYSPASADEKPHQQKLKVRALLKTVKDLQYAYVVTGPFGDAGGLYLSARPPQDEAGGTFDVKRKRAVLLGDGEGRISLTTMRDVGKLVAAALLHPEATKNKALHVNSFTSTPKQIVAEFEKQTGGEKWDVDFTPLDKLKELEQKAWAANDPKAGTVTLRRIWTEGGTLYDQRDNGLIGMEHNVDSLQDAVKQAIEVQAKSS